MVASCCILRQLENIAPKVSWNPGWRFVARPGMFPGAHIPEAYGLTWHGRIKNLLSISWCQAQVVDQLTFVLCSTHHCHLTQRGSITSHKKLAFDSNLKPRGKGQKLAWQWAWHENTMMLRMRMLPNLLPVATCRGCPSRGLSHGQTGSEPARGGSYVWSFMEIPWDSTPIPCST